MKRKDLSSHLLHLAEYESSESEEESPAQPYRKRLPPPTLPVYKEIRSITRQPLGDNNNETKIRNFPHEPGNWATYVYIPVIATSHILDFVDTLLKLLSPIHLSVAENFHISVTKTVILRHHWIEDFTNSLNEVIVQLKPFFINLSGLKVYVNENKTRTFIGLKVNEGLKSLCDTVEILDKCLADYNLPRFYKPPLFHMSILWCVGDKSDEIQELLKTLPDDIKTFNFYDRVSWLKCKSGNKMFTFNFTFDKHFSRTM